MKKYLVIYKNEEGNTIALLKRSETPDSSAPHMWELPDECEIIAVLDCGFDPDLHTIWIDETEAVVT